VEREQGKDGGGRPVFEMFLCSVKKRNIKVNKFPLKEYKKKHKRMLRIQKTKENEKVMTWRFKKKS